MNIVLFEASEIARPLPASDTRARHVLKVLRCAPGDTFDAGQINGARGKATLIDHDEAGLTFAFQWAPAHPAPPELKLAVGFPRPQTARDILRDATTLGATELSFIRTARSDPNYTSSSLWTTDEWRRHTVTGAAQAFDTHVPAVRWEDTLERTLRQWSEAHIPGVALDVYDSAETLDAHLHRAALLPRGVLIGPERGWAEADRALLAQHAVPRLGLGDRVLRTETAVVTAIGLINAARART